MYLTFARAATDDARRRFAQRTNHSVDARTTHSCAFQLFDLGEGPLLDDNAFSRKVTQVCAPEIADMLAAVDSNKQARARKTIVFFITKTLNMFIQGAKAEADSFKSLGGYGRPSDLYYPARKWHERRESGKKPPAGIPNYGFERFYFACAKKVWLKMKVTSTRQPEFYTYDSVIKCAQISQRKLDCSALLVDEAQDLTACQTDWFVQQAAARQIQVFFVGDAVQSIYHFRGAKPELLLKLDDTHAVEDLKLTISFRFGPRIACISNTILFAKHNSPQRKFFQDYRIIGRGFAKGRVTSRDLLLNSDVRPLTILGRSNAALLDKALELLTTDGAVDLKIALLGDGPSSGAKKWLSVLKDIKSFYRLYKHETSTLPLYDWEDEEIVTWNSVKNDIEQREITKYGLHVNIIELYGDETLELLDTFVERVVNRQVKEKDADIILGTCHAAKGMEWDAVQLCNDFTGLSGFKIDTHGVDGPSFYSARSAKDQKRKATFGYKGWATHSNEINLWYVAVTRAKKLLSVPGQYLVLIREMTQMKEFMREVTELESKGLSVADLRIPPWNLEDVRLIYNNLIVPWDREMQDQAPGGLVIEAN